MSKAAKKLRKLLRTGQEPPLGTKEVDLKRAVKVVWRKEIENEALKRRDEELAQRSKMFGRGGLALEKPSRKDYIREKVFGGGVGWEAGKRLEQIKSSGILNNVIFQGQENSCVSCSFTWLNMYNSWFGSENKANLDWKYLWNGVPKETGGSRPRDNGQFLRYNGQPEVGLQNPEKYKIKNYLYLAEKKYENILAALANTPVIVGFYADEAGLSAYKFGHALVCVDLNENGDYICVNWWRPDTQDIVTVPKGTKLLTALILKDLPDGVDTRNIRLGYIGALRQWL